MILSRQIEHFIAVSKYKSYRQAAQWLGLTQSALSISIKQIEDSMGTRLFDRSVRGASLTAKGQALYETLRTKGFDLVSLCQNIINEAAPSTIRLGCVNHIACHYLVPHLESLRKRWGSMQLLFGYSKTVLDSVREGSLDIGIIAWANVPRDVSAIRVRLDREAIVGIKGKFDHIKTARTLRDLRNERWIWHRKPQKSWTEYLDGNIESAIVDGPQNLRSLLLSGWGIASVQLDMFEANELKKLVYAKVRFPVHATIYIVHRDVLSEHQKSFMEHLQSFIG